MGEVLAETLNNAIDSMEMGRGDVIGRMAQEAGIDEDTVRAILSADIDCPPLTRLRGFARVIPRTFAQLQSAAERDGCSYQNNSLWYRGSTVDN